MLRQLPTDKDGRTAHAARRAALLLLAVLAPTTWAWAGTTPETVTLADGTEAAVWRPAAGTAPPYPLVLFSHGFHGCRDQSRGLMRALADHGMLVAAVNHADQRCGLAFDPSPAPEFRHPGDWTDATFRERAEQVGELRRSILAEPGLKDQVDATRVVLVGHSLGGYTVLGLAGARPGWKLDGIAAVVAWAPYTEPYGSGDVAKGIAVPVLYEAGSADLIAGVPSTVFGATTRCK